MTWMPERAVILVEDGLPGAEEIASVLSARRYRVARVRDLAMVPFLLLSGGVSAVLLGGGGLGQRDVMALQRFRKAVPGMRIVVVASGPAEMKRALDSGATAFVPWPAPARVVLDALGCGQGDSEEADRAPPGEENAPND